MLWMYIGGVRGFIFHPSLLVFDWVLSVERLREVFGLRHPRRQCDTSASLDTNVSPIIKLFQSRGSTYKCSKFFRSM
jgi:hypothetical protein